MSTVFLLTTGDGSDGDEWGVQSIHSTRELAEIARDKYSEPQRRIDGSTYVRESQIEEWVIDAPDQQREHRELVTRPMSEEGRELLLDIFENTEALQKIIITLDPLTRDVTILYEDCDDEWFRELQAAQIS